MTEMATPSLEDILSTLDSGVAASIRKAMQKERPVSVSINFPGPPQVGGPELGNFYEKLVSETTKLHLDFGDGRTFTFGAMTVLLEQDRPHINPNSEEYRSQHTHCPSCRSSENLGEQTCVGFIFGPDYNDISCGCGWKGVIDELVQG